MPVLHDHPDASNVCGRQWKCVLPAKSKRLEHNNLARKVGGGDEVREEAQLIQRGVVDAVRAIHANDTGEDRVNAKEASGERSDLVRRGGLVLERGRFGDRLELDDRIDTCRGVWHEETVVDASCIVEGDEVLYGIAYGSDGSLVQKQRGQLPRSYLLRAKVNITIPYHEEVIWEKAIVGRRKERKQAGHDA